MTRGQNSATAAAASELVALPLSVPTSDRGDEVQRAFRYQSAYGVILMVEGCLGTIDLKAIWCEHHEDLLVEQGDGYFLACQVKTRAERTGHWKNSDGDFRKSLRRFHELESTRGDYIAGYRFVSNCPPFSPTVRAKKPETICSSPLKLLEAVRGALTPSAIQPPFKGTFDELVAELLCDEETLLAVLKRLDFVLGPSLSDYEDVLVARYVPRIPTCSALLVKEVSDSLVRLKRQDTGMRSRLDEFIAEKDTVDMRLDAAMKQYDSAYLSRALELERHAASLSERIANLERQKLLPAKLDDQFRAADRLIADETEVRRKLVEARKKAEKDVSNLKRLEELFLDCLVRARFPGIKETDVVSIASPHYLPVVTSPETGDLATTSFANLGSGGKKCVFKACYALAIHRLAQGIDADLPPLLVIDSPMKNISERENEDVFSSFYEMVYELAADELATTQFLIIDKEFRAPRPGTAIEVGERHMMPDSADYPPLIPYYRGL